MEVGYGQPFGTKRLGPGRPRDSGNDVTDAQRDVSQRAREAMGKLIAGHGYDTFATFTFRPGGIPETPRRAWGYIQKWAESCGLAHGFFCIERHKSGIYHLHSLFSERGKDDKTLSRRKLWQMWFDRHGRCKLEPINEAKPAAYYVAKYINKEPGSDTLWRYWPEDFYEVDQPIGRWGGGLVDPVIPSFRRYG